MELSGAAAEAYLLLLLHFCCRFDNNRCNGAEHISREEAIAVWKREKVIHETHRLDPIPEVLDLLRRE